MILIIHTAEKDKIAIGLSSDDGDLIFRKNFSAQFDHAEKLLPAIDSLLKESESTLKDLAGIIVVSGPGGFTALRIGVITANTLAYTLAVPLAGVKLSEFSNFDKLAKVGLRRLKKSNKQSLILPYYGRPPHITKPKNKLWS